MYQLMRNIIYGIRNRSVDKDNSMMETRWTVLLKDFRSKTTENEEKFDISKIPDIYDNIKYDWLHNRELIDEAVGVKLLQRAKYMADIVVHQEYGITLDQKRSIGQGICGPLMKKLRSDLCHCLEHSESVEDTDSMSLPEPNIQDETNLPLRQIRTRIYVTSESHIHALLNLIVIGDLFDQEEMDQEWRESLSFLSRVSEYSYLSRLVLLMYENPEKDQDSAERYKIQLAFSPGVCQKEKGNWCFEDQKLRLLHSNIGYNQMTDFLHKMAVMSTPPKSHISCRTNSREFRSKNDTTLVKSSLSNSRTNSAGNANVS